MIDENLLVVHKAGLCTLCWQEQNWKYQDSTDVGYCFVAVFALHENVEIAVSRRPSYNLTISGSTDLVGF